MSEIDITYGGFSPENIKNWLRRECLESGDPINFFMAIVDAIDEIKDESEEPHYWEKVAGMNPMDYIQDEL